MSDSLMPTLLVSGQDDERPLPLIVAQKWDFLLTYAETEEGFFYAVQDWIKGLTGLDDSRLVWAKMKGKIGLLNSIQQLPYTASNGRTYQVDFATDKGLYLIAQHMRVTKARPVLDEIKKFLAAAGAFVDDVRRDANTVVISGALTPEQAMDVAIRGFHAQGRDDKWIRTRVESRIKRNLFTAALTEAVAEALTRKHYAIATDDIYKGLWDRTAAMLRKQMKLDKGVSLRDNQPMLALHYQGIAEEVAAHRLGDRSELSWHEARLIVKDVAAFVGQQAQATSRWLGIDLATGKPLLGE